MPTLGYLLTVEFGGDLGPDTCADCKHQFRVGDGPIRCLSCADHYTRDLGPDDKPSEPAGIAPGDERDDGDDDGAFEDGERPGWDDFDGGDADD